MDLVARRPGRPKSLLTALLLVTSACQSAAERGRTAYATGDFGAAIAAWRPAADAGDAEAQFLLGLAHEDGHGVRQDAYAAAIWYALAAAQGHAPAQNNLGLLHYRGRGVEPSMQRASFWFARAAAAGHPGARGNLGLMQARGEAPGGSPAESLAAQTAAATRTPAAAGR